MENHVYMKANTREEYMNMVAKIILHVREMSAHLKQNNQSGQSMQGQNQGQGPPSQGQPPQGPNSQSNLAPDPINALQTPSQGSRNQMMNMGLQGQMQQQMEGNPGMGVNQEELINELIYQFVQNVAFSK